MVFDCYFICNLRIKTQIILLLLNLKLAFQNNSFIYSMEELIAAYFRIHYLVFVIIITNLILNLIIP
jgi:hypothetical protein